MLDWLIATCDVFGLQVQNWMLVVAGVFVAYALTHFIARRHRSHSL